MVAPRTEQGTGQGATSNHWPTSVTGLAIVNTATRGGGAESLARDLFDALRDRTRAVAPTVPITFLARNDPTLATDCIASRELTFERWLRYQLTTRLGIRDLVASEPWRWHNPATAPWPATTRLLHLHNLHGDFFSLPALASLTRRYALVWTLHDAWAVTGGCAFPELTACTRYRDACGSCPQLGNYPLPASDATRLAHHARARTYAATRATLVTPSKHLAALVQDSPLGRMFAPPIVIPNGINTARFTPHPHKPSATGDTAAVSRPLRVLTFVGHDDRRKGGDDALAALAPLVRAGRVFATVVAQPSEEPRIAAALGPTSWTRHDRVPRLVSHDDERAGRPSLASLYRDHDALLFASHAENAPLTTLEAMASGLTVIAYDIAAHREQITDGTTGFLAPHTPLSAGNATALAATLRNVASLSPEARANVSTAARNDVVARFSLSTMIDRYIEVYAATCGQP